MAAEGAGGVTAGMSDAELVERWRREAARVRSELHPDTGRTPLAAGAWADLDPEFSSLVHDWALGAGYGGEELDLRTRALCTASALVALGEVRYAANWMGNALSVGATREQVVSVLRQLFFYLGTTRTSGGFEALAQALAARAPEGADGR